MKENHLRWDSLGEFLALAVSIEDLAAKTSNAQAATVAAALNAAVGRVLSENKSPGRKVTTQPRLLRTPARGRRALKSAGTTFKKNTSDSAESS